MPLKLVHVTNPADAADMVTIYFDSCQNNTLSLGCWPRTPPVRDWWASHIAEGMEKPENTYLKVVDVADGRVDEGESEGEMVAWGKWTRVRQTKSGGGDLTTSSSSASSSTQKPEDEVLPEGADAELCKSVFGAWDLEKERIMGEKDYWYLEQLFTNPKHQRRGAGSMLMKWGVHNADEEQVEAYLEASGAEGLGLYQKSGFVEVTSLSTTIESENLPGSRRAEFKTTFMVRCPAPTSQ